MFATTFHTIFDTIIVNAFVEDLFNFGTENLHLHYLCITNTFFQCPHRSNFLCCFQILFRNETKLLVLKNNTNTPTSSLLVHSQLITLVCCSFPKCIWHWPRQIVQPMYKFLFVLHPFFFFCLPYILCFTLFPFWLVT